MYWKSVYVVTQKRKDSKKKNFSLEATHECSCGPKCTCVKFMVIFSLRNHLSTAFTHLCNVPVPMGVIYSNLRGQPNTFFIIYLCYELVFVLFFLSYLVKLIHASVEKLFIAFLNLFNL